MIRSLEESLAEDWGRFKDAYGGILGYLPPHMIVHKESDERILEILMRELRLLAADCMLTADACERALSTYRGDND